MTEQPIHTLTDAQTEAVAQFVQHCKASGIWDRFDTCSLCGGLNVGLQFPLHKDDMESIWSFRNSK